jgi:beta-glucosidase
MGLGCEELTGENDLEADRDVEVTIEYDNVGASGLFAFRVGCRWMAPADLMERAVAAVGGADVAIVVVGTSNEWESEGFDRPSLVLPVDQDELVRQVAAANRHTVVVVNAGAPVAMPWVDDVAAVIQTWFGGQEMAGALADVLVGDADPGGRLPVSLPVRIEDTPAFAPFPGQRNELRYGEGLLVGYRWYEARDIAVIFPFGHGLSYATFELGEPSLSTDGFAPGEEITVTVPVTNTGRRAGTEVVQCYVAPPAGELYRPVKELKAFAKIGLDAGESGTVSLTLSDRSFSCWDPGTQETALLLARMPLGDMLNKAAGPPQSAGWRILPGSYTVHIGRSSADCGWTGRVNVRS